MPANYRVAPAMAFFGNPNIQNGEGMHFLGFSRGDVTVSPNLNIVTGRVDQVGVSPLADAVWASGHGPQATIPLIDEDQIKLVEYVLGSDYLADGDNATVGTLTKGTGSTSAAAITISSIDPGSDVQEGTYTLTVTTGGAAGTSSPAVFRLVDPSGKIVDSAIVIGDSTNTQLSLDSLAVTGAVTAGDFWTVEISDVDASWGIGSGFSKIEVKGTLALIPVNELSRGTNGVNAPNGQWFPAAVCTNFGDFVNNLPEGNDAFQAHEAVFMSTYLDFDDRPLTVGGALRTAENRNLLPRSHRNFFKGSPRSMAALSLGGVDYARPVWHLPPVTLA